MNLIPQTDTISSLKSNQSAVFAKVKKQPVLLLQNSKPLAMLVSPDEWNRAVTRIRQLELLLLHHQRLLAMQQDPSQVVTHEELERDLAEKAASLHVGN